MAEQYDIVIVGGGIHGVGVAQAAAAHGYSVLVLEQGDLAGGTSCRSSKLIHGGLRYLESGRLGLVAESLRERALLLKLAPELVRMRSFFFPIFRTTRRRPWQVRTGLSLYALLGGLRAAARFQRVERRDWKTLDGLETNDLQVVFRYQDAQTDDAALTRAVMRSAETLGARLAAPAQFSGAILTDDGCEIEYSSNGQAQSCSARVLVNAAGPWAGRVLGCIDPAPVCRAVELVQGAHIHVRGRLDAGIYYLEAPQDSRAVFVMPWQQGTLVGTTETAFDGDPGDVRVLPEERDYLLTVLQKYFPASRATEPGAVLDSFAGLRVLPAGNGPTFGRSRETFLDLDRAVRPRVLTIWGGKLTTYRSTAEKVMRRVGPSLPARVAAASTRTLELSPS